MNIKIKSTNISLNPSIEEYLEKKIEAVEKFIDASNPTLLIETELAKTTKHHQSGDIFRAEVNISIDGKQFRAVAEKTDLNSAIDEMQNQILEELRSDKGRRQSLLKRGGAKIKSLLRKFYR